MGSGSRPSTTTGPPPQSLNLLRHQNVSNLVTQPQATLP